MPWRQDCGGGDGKQLVIGHGEVGAGQFALGFFEEVDILGDAVRFVMVQQHLGGEIDELAGVKAAAICIEVFHELLGSHVGVKRALVMKVAVPKLVDRISNELGSGLFSGFK